MPIRTITEDGATHYVGLFAGDREICRSARRELVEVKLRLAFTERLEKLARDTVLLAHLVAHRDDEDRNDDVLEEELLEQRLKDLVRTITQEALELRHNEPALALGAEEEQHHLTSPAGTSFAPAAWAEGDSSALDDFRAFVDVDVRSQGALQASVDALASEEDPEVGRRLAWFLAGEYLHLDAPMRDRNRHVEVVVQLAQRAEWTAAAEGLGDTGTYRYQAPGARGAAGDLAACYRGMMRAAWGAKDPAAATREIEVLAESLLSGMGPDVHAAILRTLEAERANAARAPKRSRKVAGTSSGIDLNKLARRRRTPKRSAVAAKERAR